MRTLALLLSDYGARCRRMADAWGRLERRTQWWLAMNAALMGLLQGWTWLLMKPPASPDDELGPGAGLYLLLLLVVPFLAVPLINLPLAIACAPSWRRGLKWWFAMSCTWLLVAYIGALFAA